MQICAYMAEFIRQLKKNIRIELPSKEAKTKGSDDEGKIAAKESGSNNKVFAVKNELIWGRSY